MARWIQYLLVAAIMKRDTMSEFAKFVLLNKPVKRIKHKGYIYTGYFFTREYFILFCLSPGIHFTSLANCVHLSYTFK